MAESGIILPTDSTGKALRTETVTTTFTTGAGAVVHQQVISLGDPTTAANLAAIVAKGTQGAFALATQDLKDSGRTLFYAAGTVTPTAGTEAMLSLTPFRATTAGSAATTGMAVTSGKTLRLTGMTLTVRQAVTAAIGGVTARLRVGTGTLTTASPMLASIAAVIQTATANMPGSSMVDFPDGLELTGSQVFAVTVLGTAHPVDVVVTGFEY